MKGLQMPLQTGVDFTVRLQARTLEEQHKKIERLEIERLAAIEVAEAFRDWLAYGYKCNDPRFDELCEQLGKMRGPL